MKFYVEVQYFVNIKVMSVVSSPNVVLIKKIVRCPVTTYSKWWMYNYNFRC